MRIRSLGIVTLIAALACSLAACGGSKSDESGSSDLGTIRLGLGTTPPDLTANQFYYAVKSGFYKKRGLNVDISPFADDQTAVRALQSGEVDVIWTGALAGMSAMQGGAKMKVISATAPVLGFEVVGIQSIKRPKDVEGHKLGISAPGAVSAVTPIIMLQNDGGDPKKVQVLPIGGSGARAAALAAKKIDVAVLNQPYVSQMSKYPFLHVIAKAAEAIPDYIYSFEMTSDEVIKDHPKALKAFVAGSVEADKWAIANPDKAVQMSHQVLPDVPVEDLKLAIDDMAKTSYWSTTGDVSQKQWDFTTKSLLDNKLLPKPIAYSDYVDTQFSAKG
ncbi:MAG: PhnD/SsuA/transferrin family substrate-binding protein [Streptosporangiales bacterium]|nr:PhnD/SsuA/transferrin family substrate-binding protein [Streptosporangiales bacterium]